MTAVLVLLPALAGAQPFTIVSAPATDSLAVVDLAGNTVIGSIAVGGMPSACALAPRGERLYAVLTQSNALAIVDTRTGAVQSVAVGARPAAVAVESGFGRVYVANTGGDSVSVVDPGRAAVVATIAVGDAPFDLVASGRYVYAANWGGNSVSAIDVATGAVVKTIAVGRLPAALAAHRATRRLYVASFFDDTVTVIDTFTNSVLSTIPVARRPRSLAVDASGQRLYVGGFEDGRVQIVDTATGTVSLDAPSGGLNPVDLMLSPDGTRLYAAHLQEAQAVAVLDAQTLAPVTSIAVPAGPTTFAGVTARAPAPLLAEATPAAVGSRPGLVPDVAAGGEATRAPAGGNVVILDGSFPLADWAMTGSGQLDATQEAAGGNPGSYRRVTHFGPASSVHRLVRPGATYDPGTQGAVATIDVSWERRVLTEAQVFEAFVVEQDGVVYRTSERAFVLPVWQADSRVGLTAADFDDGTGAHPDFTDFGPELRFGYSRRTTAATTVPHGIDNFMVTVHPSPVTSPGRLALRQTADLVRESDSPFVYVRRLGGTLGAVSATLHVERPDGTTSDDTVSWADGDNFDRAVLVLFLDLPPGSGARTARLTLTNPTGGATLQADRTVMILTVIPDQWPSILVALFLQVQPLLSAFSPAWLVVLAAPGALVAWRRR